MPEATIAQVNPAARAARPASQPPRLFLPWWLIV